MSFRERLFESRAFERGLEIMPGAVTWSALVLPAVLSFFVPRAVAYFIIAFDLFWLQRWLRFSTYLIKGYWQIKQALRINWAERLKSLHNPGDYLDALITHKKKLETTYPALKQSLPFGAPKPARLQYYDLKTMIADYTKLSRRSDVLNPDQVWHLVLIATYTEELNILEPTVQALTKNDFPLNRVVVAIAGDERDEARARRNGEYLKERYGEVFAEFLACIHPENPEEGKFKGAQISYAAEQARQHVFAERGIPYENVVVTVLDADTIIPPQFLTYLAYMYATTADRVHHTYQPIPFFYNNIWDAPAPNRLLATGSSFWQVMESTRPERLRNFSSHSMSLEALVQIDYWDRFSINEDSRQFWRAYFAFEGKHSVIPLFVPVYNDAVLGEGYFRTLKNQYKQLRRWAYGASEIPYVIRHFIRTKNIKFSEKLVQTGRVFEGHFSWATAPIFMTFVAWFPIVINAGFKNEVLAHELPRLTSVILTLGMSGLIVSIWISLILLPPRPKKYHGLKHVAMVLQWAILPLTTIIFSTLPAIDAQTRLMLGKYMDFWVTEKARKHDLLEAPAHD